MIPDNIFTSCLTPTDSSLVPRIEEILQANLGDNEFLATSSLDLDEYVRLGHCEIMLKNQPHPISVADWGGEDADYLVASYEQAVWEVRWRGIKLHVLKTSWATSCGMDSRFWVIGETSAVVTDFILDLHRKTNTPGESILVFHGGHWQRSRELYLATQKASFDDLILSGSLQDAIRNDFQHFLNARPRYESLGVAWRRGALFIGPPGNGKTHCVRALVKELQIPSLYVQSLTHSYFTSEDLLKSVFHRARQLRPCVLIFEDLDALVTEANRSFFLNQLDGFEKNVGLIVLATTNHPERIDPAILNRPSRFDRKYHFNLPELIERTAYLGLWQVRLAAETGWVKSQAEQLAIRTDGFSFAYLKELVVSSLLRWIHQSGSKFFQVLEDQCAELRQQMLTTPMLETSMGAETADLSD
ncbi:MAG: ATP-binding protein [Planctomycetota bacterium]|nr:ATP-binding protein [Planctomycetota bacterium]